MTPTSLRNAVAALAAALVAGGAARAADAPHDTSNLTQGCQDCHVLHSASGATLTKQAENSALCLSCHQGGTGGTVLNWAASDQAVPGTSGSSHRWDSAAVNPAMGARLPMSAWATHLANGTNLQCSTCHDEHSQGAAPFDPTVPASGAGRHFLRAANDTNQLCVDCHAAWNQPSAAAGAYYTSGTATFTSGSATVTGAGTAWLANVQPGWRVKPLAAGAAAWSFVKTVDSDTSLTLAAPYGGTTATGQAYVASKTLSHPLVTVAADGTTLAAPVEVGGAAQGAVFGTSTGGTATSLVQAGRNFAPVVGWKVRFTSGVDRGYTRTITSVSAGNTQINWSGTELPALPGPIGYGVAYEIDADGNFSNDLWLAGAGGTSAAAGQVVCMTCHGVHFADSDATTYDDRAPTPAGKGDGYLLRRAKAETCQGCHPNTIIHSSANTSTKHGTWGGTFDCFTCHQPHQTGNVHLVRPSIATPSSGTRDVDLRSTASGVEPYGLVNSASLGAGACEVCHTDTRNGAEVTGATSTFTAGGTAVTLSSTAGLAAGWEIKRTADGPGAWTKIQAVNTGTTLTLWTGYKGTSGGAGWRAANPRFRNTGSGAGVGASSHYTGNCLGCHPHSTAFAPSGMTCSSCHGTAGRTLLASTAGAADPNLEASPPLDHLGSSTSNGVGPHLGHVRPDPAQAAGQMFLPVKCQECHGTAVSTYTSGHSNGTNDVLWTGAAYNNLGGVTPSWSAGVSPAAGTCASSYCHGTNLTASQKGSVASWQWNTTTVATCGSCHGAAPNDAVHTSVSKSAAATACNPCHQGVVDAAGKIIFTGSGATAATKHIDGAVDTTGVTCHSCHGSATNDAPPLAANGANVNAVGAHQSHLAPTQMLTRTTGYACTECHPSVAANNHANGTVQMAWNLSGGATVWSGGGASTSNCATSWCHGGTAAQAGWGGTLRTPLWNDAGDTYRGCNACHRSPPLLSTSSPHPGNLSCGDCHPAGATASGIAAASAEAGVHVNGTVDTLRKLCTSCHGDFSQDNVARTGNAAAPGIVATAKDTIGNTGSAAPGVGAHGKHLTGTKFKTLNGGFAAACGDCHQVPASDTDTSHATGVSSPASGSRASLVFSNVAKTGLVSGGTVLAAAYGGSTTATATPGVAGTCSNTYCHGGKWVGNASYAGTAVAPSWTGGPMDCNSCHKSAPTSSAHSGVTSTKNCADCHGASYNCTTGSLATCQVDLALHINGAVDTPSMTCTSCHGTTGRTALLASTIGAADAHLDSSPPVDHLGSSTSNAVGPHLGHVRPDPAQAAGQMFLPVKCQECHGTAVNTYTTSHSNGTNNVLWTGTAYNNLGGVTPSWAAGVSPAAGTCASSYCHGTSLTASQKGSVASWQWNTTTVATCGSCHGAAPNDAVHTSVSKSAAATACNPCHQGVVDAAGKIIFTGSGATAATKHIDGAVDTTGVTCHSCHGSATNDAPPAAANGANVNAIGAHQSHVAAGSMLTRSTGYACTECHPSVAANNHANGTVQMAWSLSGASTAWSGGAASTSNCATSYCHGGTAAQAGWGGTLRTPLWNDAGDTYRGCGACHRSPPLLSTTSPHPGNTTCNDCHPAGATTGGITAASAEAGVHVNGTVNVLRTLCTSCHGDFAQNGVVRTSNAAAPGFNATARDTLGNTAATAPGVGAHGKHLTGTKFKTLNGGFAAVCGDCHQVAASDTDTTHATGVSSPASGSRASLVFSNVAKTGLASGGTALSAAYGGSTTATATPGVAGTCSNTYCHGGKYAGYAVPANYVGTVPTPSWTGAAMDCNSCHKSPPASAIHSGMSSTQSCSGCHGAGYVCTIATLSTCQVDLSRHINGAVEASGESSGGNACDGCHGFTATMASGTAHRHQMLASQPTTYPTTATAQQCLQCHADHNIFRPDLNATAGVTRAKNLRTDIASAPTTTANYTDTDFDNAQTNGGICTSCHRTAQTKAAGLPDAGATTPVVDKLKFNPSAHNYVGAVGTAQFKDGATSTAKPNCSKCHNDNGTKQYQGTGTPPAWNGVSLHNSTLSSETAPLGAATPTSPMEEDFCYRCHSQTTDALTGTKKATAGKDFYGGQAMSTQAERIYTAFQNTFRHPVNGTRNVHKVTGDSSATRHVECADCHDVHGTKPRGTPYAGSITTWAAGTSPALDTITDSTKAWTANQLVGWTIRVTTGTQAGKTSLVYGNAATTLQVKFGTAPAVGDKYVLVDTGIRLATGTEQLLSPALAGAVQAVVPTFGAAPTPPSWNDSAGCGAAGTANTCESITTSLTLPTYAATTAPVNEAQICLRCHSSYAYGSAPPNSPSGQPTTATGSGQTWSNTVGVAMRESDLGGDLNPSNAGHHAVFARGNNQPMVSSATATQSVLNANWPRFTSGTGTVSVTAGQTTVTLSAGSWPTGILPGWFIFIGSNNPAAKTAGWYEIAAVTGSTTLALDRACAANAVGGNVATATTCGAGQAYMITPGLGSAFVPPYGPWSRLNCSDCHQSTTITDPLGPHGSANKWMLRTAQTQTFVGYTSGATTNPTATLVTLTPTDANIFCMNCHRRDVYGDYNYNPSSSSATQAKFSRQTHPADSSNASSLTYRTRWGILCMNCHGGARQGGIHGENLGQGGGGTGGSYSGKRLLGGSSWYAVTRGSTGTAGQCWTKGNTDAVDGCGHSHSGVNFQSGVANYDYDSTQTSGIK